MIDEKKDTMKAMRIHTYGGPEVLVYEDVARPQPAVGEVLLRVHAAGVNPADWKTRRGPARPGAVLPMILGWDVSGAVEALGPGVTEFQKGDAVYGMIRFPQAGATYAEYVAAPVSQIAHKPANVDPIHAAAIPLAGLTAWQALIEKAHISAGQKVLILGAAGGVGHLAVQLARSQGAYVLGTASTRNIEFLHHIGIDLAIDYTTTPLETAVHNVDVVFDTVGGETRERSLRVIKQGGMLVSIVLGRPTPEQAASGVNVQGMMVQPNAAQLAQLAQLVDAGKIHITVDTVLPLADARKAHELSESHRTRGKIVLRVAE
ncbi:MAG TPA: NADP-dependent oxidoreductase [Ktedonobacteraceae bacterium]